MRFCGIIAVDKFITATCFLICHSVISLTVYYDSAP